MRSPGGEALEIRGSNSSRTVASRHGHHIRQEMADSLQRVREGMHTAINGRLDAISSISSAMQRLSACTAETVKPSRISDLIPKSWDGSHDKGQFRNFMAERILVRVESVDKVDRSTL